MADWCQWSVGLVALPDVSHHVDLEALAARLDQTGEIYRFRVLPAIEMIPEPTEPTSRGGNFSPQYDPAVLFGLLDAHLHRHLVDFVVGVIDSEIYDEIFSTINPSNSAILVSLRTPTLPEILRKSGRAAVNYVGLEIAAQLLCIQYRRATGLISEPSVCAPPWHVQRLNCLFDWYGISPTNVTKLQSPKLSGLARKYFEDARVPAEYVEAGVQMARLMSRYDIQAIMRMLLPDPFLGVAFGALFGWLASTASSGGFWLNAGFIIAVLFLVGWRGFIILWRQDVL